MDDKVKLMIDTAFSTDGIWDDVNDTLMDNIKQVLPSCFIKGTKEYEKVNGYEKLPWKVKHHLDIRMEMYNDLKRL